MDYTEFSREQLLDRIKSLEMLTQELLNEKEQETRLEYAWTGNLGHWYWNIKTNEVTFNPLKVTTLGYDKSEIPEHVTYQFFTDKLHPEDFQKAMDAMRDHLYGKADVYEIEYRIKAKDGTFKWYYDRGRITQYDNGKPAFLAGIVFDITEKKETQLELEYKNRILSEISSIDGLTKIGNHRTLIEHLKAEIAETSRTSSPLSIALFDIDDFKKVNDSKGHVYGDQVLVDLASIITKSIRGTDFAGRYGGEEFMVIFPNTTLSVASKISERIRQAVEDYNFVDGLRVTISGGTSQYNNETITELVHSADTKLYTAKRNGKNQIVSDAKF
ncbi:diguanylate cyclase [Lactonifactor sp. BIOML-A3]|uniref:diguanylate cyclase n=1 Tax=unclassified Lactonifactor TaxID=2636670 RepID=UPI0012AFE9B9|nr:diguanylate cyclase [Lactonifactor sp. BIOML-A5]MSA10359.1 diguanylate cyclase [Lactonifactor sp. BIOML-A4]MSA14815.1 diguanylate cyclase [Lactonifactor sp. BIOML-A3]MSA19331.1 diguanylate cyclase [Lactonifactor sp. BIOML-A2]MSA39911.1 diguanylate cyclase [Lactonifactor sp. BIOML-A1]MSB15739.1 diguanylate cyclase [Lactonifactor sp. BIOML-A6]MSB71305.1 diguanylate cyclase [Lactonifactor sp. BIOML-A7]